jgi:uncharacterized protein YciI
LFSLKGAYLNHYLIVYRPPRPTFPDDITEQEAAVIGDHFEYLKKLLVDGALLLAGRTEDAAMGLAILRAEHEQQAEQIMRSDPAVKTGIFNATIYPYRLALFAGSK